MHVLNLLGSDDAIFHGSAQAKLSESVARAVLLTLNRRQLNVRRYFATATRKIVRNIYIKNHYRLLKH